MNFRCIRILAFAAWPAFAAEVVPLEITEVKPVRVEVRGDIFFADFGADAYGNLKVIFPQSPPTAEWKVRLGERLDADGAIDRTPPGSVNFREVTLALQPSQRSYQLEIPPKKFHQGAASVKMPKAIGEVTPFRYVEIEGAGVAGEKFEARQLFVHAPYDDDASSFESSDETLNAVWNLCKHTMKATTAFGIYIDGERERIPYEADAYLNQLSHYACDLDSRIARNTIDHLLAHPTWPTEWSLHMPLLAAEDYLATGDPKCAAANYDALKEKLLMNKARADGLLVASAIVDWPAGERDGYNDGQPDPKMPQQVGPEVNTVANAFYFRALQRMALLAGAFGKDAEAHDLEAKAQQVHASFNRVFMDASRGVYIDGEGSAHASLHANMFALAFGLVPEERENTVADFVQSRGMACSVYGAQYLLEALFAARRDEAALKLLCSRATRSWWHMIELGSTMTLEAWDPKFKKNLTWNHAWGSAPANIISRFVLGVRPAAPGYSRTLIAPQPGSLPWVRGKVPTAHGPVSIDVQNAAVFTLALDLPPGTTADVVVPRRSKGRFEYNGKSITGTGSGTGITIRDVAPGRNTFSSQ